MARLTNRPKTERGRGALWRVLPVASCALALAIVLGGSSAAAQTSAPALVYEQLLSLRNAGAGGDATAEEQLLALFAPDAVGQGDVCIALGPQQRECDWGESNTALFSSDQYEGLRHTILTSRTSGSVVSGKQELTNAVIQEMGFERIIENYELELREGKIVRWSMNVDPTDPETLSFLQAIGVVPIPAAAGSAGIAAPAVTSHWVGWAAFVATLTLAGLLRLKVRRSGPAQLTP